MAEDASAVDTLAPGDARLPALLALNNAHADALSWLDPAEFDRAVGRAFLAGAIGTDALLLAYDQDAAYGSPNFRWFREREPRFVYVDRVVVAPAARGRGLARRLYAALFARAAAAGHRRVTCEVNLEPPNPGSDAFHRTLGFGVVGQADRPGKRVRFYARDLPPPPG